MASFELATAAVPPVDDRIVHQVPVADIRPSPYNPRHRLEGIDELAASIAEHQLLQPVVVRRRGRDGYELIAGHRRLEAVKQLGWTEIPAVVRDETTAKAYILTLVENLQREDLTAHEEAAALEVLVREQGWTTRQVGEAIKRSPMYVSRRLRVFDDEALKPMVLRAEQPLKVSTAEELLREPDPDARRQLAERAARENWSPSTARQAVAASRNGPLQLRRMPPRLANHIRELSDELTTVDPSTVTARARHEAIRLLDVLLQLTRGAADRPSLHP